MMSMVERVISSCKSYRVGVAVQDHCRSCQGAGVVKGNREVRVDIPAGQYYTSSTPVFFLS